MAGWNLIQRWGRVNNPAGALGASDIADLVDTNQGLVQLSAVRDVTNTGAGKLAAGTGTFVSGTVVIATGLTLCTTFVATMIGTGATATGATEIERAVAVSITTGAVTVNGSYHSGTAAVMVQSVSGTAAFHWLAYGT
jgi:hypothetical protein